MASLKDLIVNGFSRFIGNVNVGGTLDAVSLKQNGTAVSLSGHTHDDRYYTESEIDTKLNAKQNTLTAGKGIKLASNKVSCTALYTITEDMFDLETDATKGVSPYNTSYGYTNITIHDDLGIEWTEGAVYSFSLDTKVAVSAYRNVRVRIGTSGDWKPMMSTSAIASGTTVFVKGRNCLFIYKSVYQSAGALHALWDDGFNNYKLRDYGRIKAGAGTYAITRYSLLMQKPDGTWEKITSTAADYSTGTGKSVNTSGFLLNQIKYYNTTATVAGGSYTADATVDSQHEGFDFRYSSNCGTPSSWVQGQYIYLVGTIGADNLFHLDSSAWWTNALPSSNDGKIYIQLGVVRTAGSYTVSLLNDRPVLYHDGTGIRLYAPSSGGGEVHTFTYTFGSSSTALWIRGKNGAPHGSSDINLSLADDNLIKRESLAQTGGSSSSGACGYMYGLPVSDYDSYDKEWSDTGFVKHTVYYTPVLTGIPSNAIITSATMDFINGAGSDRDRFRFNGVRKLCGWSRTGTVQTTECWIAMIEHTDTTPSGLAGTLTVRYVVY